MTEYNQTDFNDIGQSQEPNDEQKAAYARRFIEMSVVRYKIFIDTCSLLDPCAAMFWENITPFLMQYGRYVIIPERCIEEVEKQISNKANADLADRAKKMHDKLYDLAMQHLIEVRGEKTDGFADSVFLSVGAKFRTVYDMMLITQDRTLANEFTALGASQAVRTTRSIVARRINRHGFLSPFRDPTALQEDGAELLDDNEQLELISTEDLKDVEQNISAASEQAQTEQ